MQERLVKLLIPMLATAWLAFAPATALAAGLWIEFDLSQSRLELLGGQIEIPRDGSVSPGSRVVVGIENASDGLAPLPGAAWLDQLDLEGHFDVELFDGVVQLSGRLGTAQQGRATGLLSDGFDLLLVSQAVFDIGLDMTCTGPSCALLGVESTSVAESTTLSGALFDVAGLEVPGSAALSIARDIEVNGLVVHLELVGTELRRGAALPEPSSALLLAFGLAALAASRGRGASSSEAPQRDRARPAAW